MNLRTITIVGALAILASANPAHATGNHTPPKPKEPPSTPTTTAPPVYTGVSNSGASAGAAAGARSSSDATSTSGASVGNVTAGGGGTATAATGPNTSQSASTGGTANSTSGDSSAASTNTIQDSSNFWSQSRALGLTFAPGAFTPPLPAINNPCSPTVTQSARGLGMGILSRADAKTDPRVCHIIERRNNAWRECRYATAKQIDDLLMAEMLPGFVPPAETYLKDANDPGFVDFSPQHCALLTNPPPKPVEPVTLNWIYVPPPVARVEEPAPPPAAKPVPPAPPAKPRKPSPAKSISTKPPAPGTTLNCGDDGIPQCVAKPRKPIALGGGSEGRS